MKKKITKLTQEEALKRVEATLKGIDAPTFWAKVIKRLSPKVDANERVRQRSFAAAHKRFIPNHS